MSSYIAGENVFATQLIGLLLILSGDLEQNLVPEKEKSHIIFCQWNLNGLMTLTLFKFHYSTTPLSWTLKGPKKSV